MMTLTTKKNLVKMGAKARWQENLHSSHTIRNFESIIMDHPTELGGSNKGCTPLEMMAATLNGSKAIMIPLIAKELNFSFTDISFTTEGAFDPQGLMGTEYKYTYFNEIDFSLEIETEESDESLAILKSEVEKRCPIYNLLIDAGIQVNAKWIKI